MRLVVTPVVAVLVVSKERRLTVVLVLDAPVFKVGLIWTTGKVLVLVSFLVKEPVVVMVETVPSASVLMVLPVTAKMVLASAAWLSPNLANWGVAVESMDWGTEKVMVVPEVAMLTWFAVPARVKLVTAVAPELVPTN